MVRAGKLDFLRFTHLHKPSDETDQWEKLQFKERGVRKEKTGAKRRTHINVAEPQGFLVMISTRSLPDLYHDFPESPVVISTTYQATGPRCNLKILAPNRKQLSTIVMQTP